MSWLKHLQEEHAEIVAMVERDGEPLESLADGWFRMYALACAAAQSALEAPVQATAPWPGHENHAVYALGPMPGVWLSGQYCDTCKLMSIVAEAVAQQVEIDIRFGPNECEVASR